MVMTFMLRIFGLREGFEHDGTLIDNGDDTWTFSPTGDFSGPIALAYDVSDGTDTTPAYATVQVDAVNDAPMDGGGETFTMSEDGTLTISEADLLGSSSDPDNDVLHIENLELGEGASGTLTLNDESAAED